jgi:hypothetical protein
MGGVLTAEAESGDGGEEEDGGVAETNADLVGYGADDQTDDNGSENSEHVDHADVLAR